MDFMNLNQSAHGDREFAYMATRMGVRRKTVAGHWRDPRTLARIGTGAAPPAAGARRSGCGSRGSATTCATSRSPRATRSKRRSGSACRSRGTASVIWSDAIAPPRPRRSTEIVDAYDALLRGRARARRRRRAPRLTDRRRPDRGRAADVPARRRATKAFTDTFEDLHGLAQLPGIAAQRLMADGYGFGAEGDWKTAALLRIVKVMARGLPGGTSFMEDYTYDLTPGDELVLGAHMLEVCPTIAAGRPSVRDPPAQHRRPRGPRPARVRRGAGPRDRRSACSTSATASGWSPTRSTSSRPNTTSRRLPVARAVWEPQTRLLHGNRGLARRRRAAPHRVHRRCRARCDRRSRRDRRHRTAGWIDESRTTAAVAQRTALERGLLRTGMRLMPRLRDRHRLRDRVRDGCWCSTSTPARSSRARRVAYPSAVIDRTLPGTGEQLPTDWALQDPDDWSGRRGRGVPAAIAPGRGRSGRCRRARRRLHLLHGAAGRRRRAAAVHLGWLARPPHAWPKLWKHHAAQPVADRLNEVADGARRDVPRALRRQDLLGVVLPEADRDLARGSRGLRRGRRVHRGDRLDRLVA